MPSARTAPRRSSTAARPARRTVHRPARRPARPAPRRRPAGGTAVRPAPRRRSRPDARVGWWVFVSLALLGIVGLAWQSDDAPDPVAPARCVVTGADLTLTPEQADNARTIAAVAAGRGLPRRAVVIALATAMQESRLRNLPYGDRDSLGLFQQRPSQGWGTPAQVQDPAYAAGRFFDHLVQVPDWQTGDLTTVADAVQHSAFPRAYGRWTAFAEELAATLAGSAAGCP